MRSNKQDMAIFNVILTRHRNAIVKISQLDKGISRKQKSE